MFLYVQVRKFCTEVVIKRKFRRKFIDSLRLYVAGGAGGMGLPKYGGVGGKGGSVYFVGKDGLTLRDTMKALGPKRIQGKVGENSHKKSILGAPGEDAIVEVPLGISVLREDGSQIVELNKEGEHVLVAKGGDGGSIKTNFIPTKGEAHMVILDLKIIADVGLVGFPNAGKSTLLSAISNAKPKIASYPFTTMEPSIGMVECLSGRCLSVADLPGLTEGAHANIGLGHRFLKHVERTPLLLFVVDVGGFRLGHKYQSRSALETIILLNKELELYKEELIDKPAVLIVNKMDKNGSQDIFDELCQAIKSFSSVFTLVPEKYRPTRPIEFEEIIPMSAKLKVPEELAKLKEVLETIVDRKAEENEPFDEENFKRKLQSAIDPSGPLLV